MQLPRLVSNALAGLSDVRGPPPRQLRVHVSIEARQAHQAA
jgi:hypothetical protein